MLLCAILTTRQTLSENGDRHGTCQRRARYAQACQSGHGPRKNLQRDIELTRKRRETPGTSRRIGPLEEHIHYADRTPRDRGTEIAVM